MPPGAVMAKRDTTTVKITLQMWQDLKLISAITGEKMNDYVERVLSPILARDRKKAKEQLAKQDDEEGGK